VLVPPEPLPAVIEEQWYQRPVVVRTLGGLATAAAVVAAGFSIWNHHELNELEHRQPTVIEKVVLRHDNHHTAAIIPDNGYATPAVLEANGYHLAYYNRAHGRKLTGVWLPKNVQLKGSPGNYQIVKDGKVLVQKAQWDSQGKLTRTNMDTLREKFKYNIGWGNLKGDRLVSVVATR
jgi:hypothetical protein